MKTIECLTIILTVWCQCSHQYKPVFLLHGVGGNTSDFTHLVERINQAHPGTVIHNSNTYANAQSFTNIPAQIAGDLKDEFLNFSRAYPDGFHFIGFSQGCIISRGLIETYEEHTVQNYIAISGPMAGQYGPGMLGNLTLPYQSIYFFFYNPAVQRALSIADYWNDPNHHDFYLLFNIYLPYIDNELPSANSATYKRSFTKLKNLVTIGGPQDGLISPWQTSHFSFIDANGTIVNYKDRDVYKNDSFGLRTLDETGRFHVLEMENVMHLEWTRNDQVIDKFILPWLD